MAGELPRFEPPPGNPSDWPRGWIDYRRYQDIHERYMNVLYREGIVYEDNLVFEQFRNRSGQLLQVRLSGHIYCRAVTIRVDKWMDVRGERGGEEVLTTWYQYQAWLPAPQGRRDPTLLRYDQAHGDSPHRHELRADGEERCEPLTFDAMPRLDAVVREAVELARSREEEREAR